MKDPEMVREWRKGAMLSAAALVLMVALGLRAATLGAWWAVCIHGACATWMLSLLRRALHEMRRWQ